MTVKEIAKKVIDTLPDEASIDDIMHALYIQAKFDKGIQEIEGGKGIPHEEAKKRMREWVK
jgi:predicted transcriptional regulator